MFISVKRNPSSELVLLIYKYYEVKGHKKRGILLLCCETDCFVTLICHILLS
jgi:hypothetical protein